MKNSLEGINNIFEQREERISQIDGRAMEIIKSEEQKEIMLKQTEQSLRELLETINKPTYALRECQKE